MVHVEGTITTNVFVEEEDFILAMINKLLKGINYDKNLIQEKDGALYKVYDASYHGSPDWKYQLITDDKNIIKKFNLYKELLAYLTY